MRSSRSKGGGGGAHCAPSRISIFICRLLWNLVQMMILVQVMIFKIHVVPSKFLKVTMWERISTKCDQKWGNIIFFWHTLKESNVWSSNYNIISVNDLNTWYFISLMIKEDIPYLEWMYWLQLMVQTLNETAIYHMEILNQHERAPNTI